MSLDRDRLIRCGAALRSLLYAAGFVLLWYWVATLVRLYDDRVPSPPMALRPLGVALALVGAAVTASCVFVFTIRGQGTPAPFDAPRLFVAAGPYRFVRNPMYLGAAGVIAGFGLLLRSGAIVLLAVAFLLFFHGFVVLYEEPALGKRFGESYDSYRRSVRRWLPRPAPRVLLVLLVTLGGLCLLAARFLRATPLDLTQSLLDRGRVMVAVSHRVVLEPELQRQRGVIVERDAVRPIQLLIGERPDRRGSRRAVLTHCLDRSLLRDSVVVLGMLRIDAVHRLPRHPGDRLACLQLLRQLNLQRIHRGHVVHHHADLAAILHPLLPLGIGE